MTAHAGSLPDPTRPDVTAPMFSTWWVGTPQRQRAAMDAIAATWTALPWPTPALRSYTVFPGTDGGTLLHYSQWADDAAYQAFVATHRGERNDAIDAAVPGIERIGLHRYRRHRSLDETSATPRLFAVVTAELAAPDPAGQRAWADAVLDRPRPGGLIVAHAHLGTDGLRVLILEDWTDEHAQPEAGDVAGATTSRFGYPIHLAP